MVRMADPEATKRALLDAGRAEFAAHGLAGARTDRIAAASGVNKQRIYAYFGNKDGLFTAVLADALDAVLGLVPLPADEQPSSDLLAAYVSAMSAYHREHPEFLRLLLWEALELGPTAPAGDARALVYREKVEGLATRLGLSPDAAAPLLFGAIGLAVWPHVVPQLCTLIMGGASLVARDEAVNWATRSAAIIGASA